MKIFIDNGHGRDTAGKRSPDGEYLEYYYNRIVAGRVTAGLRGVGSKLPITGAGGGGCFSGELYLQGCCGASSIDEVAGRMVGR